MVYEIVRFLLRVSLRVYFRKIYFLNEDNIPKQGPVILACNHPNAFMDAMLTTSLLKRRSHFLVRSDVFNTKFKTWLLGLINLAPIYRMQEGIENLHKNQETFSRCNKILENGGMILIFSEGLCVFEKRLRPLKKGTARIIYGAEAKNNFNLGIKIVPVGINYTYGNKPRKEAIVSFGKPIDTKDYQKVYEENNALGINKITKDIEEKLKGNIVCIEDKEDENLAEQLFVMYRNEKVESTSNIMNRVKTRDRVEVEHFVTKKIQNIRERSLEELKNLKQKAGQYYESLYKYDISDATVNRNGSLITIVIKLILAFPFFMVGLVLGVFPVWLGRKITNDKVRQIEFYSSVQFALTMILGVVYLLLLFTVFNIILPWNWYYVLIGVALIPLFGLGAIRFTELLNKLIENINYSKAKDIEQIKAQRAEIMLILNS